MRRRRACAACLPTCATLAMQGNPPKLHAAPLCSGRPPACRSGSTPQLRLQPHACPPRHSRPPHTSAFRRPTPPPICTQQGFPHHLFPLYMDDDDALLRASHAAWVLDPLTRERWLAGWGPLRCWRARLGARLPRDRATHARPAPHPLAHPAQPRRSALPLPLPPLQQARGASCTWNLRQPRASPR